MLSKEHSWLGSLLAGDQVIVSGRRETLRRVTRVTPCFVVVGDSRFRKSDGGLVGSDGCFWSSLVEATPERVQALKDAGEKVRLVNKIGEAYKSATLEQLVKIEAILDGKEAARTKKDSE